MEAIWILSFMTLITASNYMANEPAMARINEPNSELATTDFMSGNWEIKDFNHNGRRLMKRETFRFFGDQTGLKGTNDRFEWRMNDQNLTMVTYENGQKQETIWKVKRTNGNKMELSRFAKIITPDGHEVIKVVQVELTRL